MKCNDNQVNTVSAAIVSIANNIKDPNVVSRYNSAAKIASDILKGHSKTKQAISKSGNHSGIKYIRNLAKQAINKSGTRYIDNPQKSYTHADVNDDAKNKQPGQQSLIDEKKSDCIARVKRDYPGLSNPEAVCDNVIQGDTSDTAPGTKAAQLSFKSEKECIGHLVQRGSTPQSAQSQCAKIFSDTEDQQELPSEDIGEGPEPKQSTRTISMSDGRGGGGNTIVTTKMSSANKLRAEGKTIKSAASDMSAAKMLTIFDSYYSTGGYQDKSQSIKSASAKDKLNWLGCEIRTQQRHNELNKSDDNNIPSRTHSASTRPAWQVLSEKASELIDSHRS